MSKREKYINLLVENASLCLFNYIFHALFIYCSWSMVSTETIFLTNCEIKRINPSTLCRNWKKCLQNYAEMCSAHIFDHSLHTPISLQQYVITPCSYLWFSCLYDLTYLRCLYINMHKMSLIIQSKLINEKIKKYLQYMITSGRHNNFLQLVFLRLQLLCIGVCLVTPYNV